ncbi:class II aldolase/adducin family protein [Desulfobulbus alkaliphilus]|nr:class II aldolase/adducin family protein [Desulfobulbus alkaliphilus]
MDGKDLRRKLLSTARAMNALGLNQATSGNLSVRCGDGFLITPSALAYQDCTPEDVVWLDFSGQLIGGGEQRKPSSEWRMHRDIYRHHPKAGGILHAHSPYCSVLACLERPIPPFHYMVALAGGDSIRCAPYATFGTQELSNGVLEALRDRCAALLAHHGMICCAVDLDRVLELAIEVENLARVYVLALQVAEPPLLSPRQMEEVLHRFREYKA